MLDNGIISHSEFAESATKETPGRWGNTEYISSIHGLIRKAPHQNNDYQRQKDALFTIGRMIREEKIEAYSYSELNFERARGRTRIQEFNALQGCKIHRCSPAIERSKFAQTTNFREIFAKGGKADRKAGVPPGGANQIAFLETLCSLTKEGIQDFIQIASLIGLSEFEIESLRKVSWFQSLCKISRSSEDYPDFFHLWTCERNGLDIFLTLDSKLSNLVSGAKTTKRNQIEINTEVLRPLELLQRLGIDKPDPVPMEADRFYPLFNL